MRPFRTVFLWQLIATAVLALLAAVAWGLDGAISAALGGSIYLVAGSMYGWMVSRGRARSAAEALRTMFRAEALKILLIIVLLWLALANYRSIVHGVFLGSFVVAVAVFAAGIAVRDRETHKTRPVQGQE